MLDKFYNGRIKDFCLDIESVRRYALEHCKGEVGEVLANAENLLRGSFLFNLRWDMEKTINPVDFSKGIDWLYVPEKDHEFIYALNRMRFWLTYAISFVMTGDERYALEVRQEMTDWIKNIRRSDPRCWECWRTIEAGIRMEIWCKVMRLLKGSRSLDEEFFSLFLSSMEEHASFLMEQEDEFHQFSNWGILAFHGLFIASVLLSEVLDTSSWMKFSLSKLDLLLRMSILSDGVHWEQSAMYHNEMVHDYLDVLLLAKRNGIVLPSGFEDKVEKMCLSSTMWQKPNGSEPMSGDSDDIDQRDNLEKAAIIFSSPLFRAYGGETLSLDSLFDVGYEACESYMRMEKGEKLEGLLSLEESGHYYVKHDGFYLSFKNGSAGAGHGHEDMTHVDLYLNGEDVLSDSGRFSYVEGEDRYYFKLSESHNVLRVDGRGYMSCPERNSWAWDRMTKAVNNKAKSKDGVYFIEGGHLGYMDNGVFLNRKVVVLPNKVVLVSDEFYGEAEKSHEYEGSLHFAEDSHLAFSEYRALYESKRNRLSLTFFGADSISPVPSFLSRCYNKKVENPALVYKTVKKGRGAMNFIVAPGNMKVEKLTLLSTRTGRLLPDEDIEAFRVGDFVVVIAHYEWAMTTETFEVEGHVGYGQVVVFPEGEKYVGSVISFI